MTRRLNKIKNAFTLIELLIVVAIIAILAAIAVPNFLEAQTRAKVSRVKADLRTLAGAMEVYFTDYNTYFCIVGTRSGYSDRLMWNLTTPIAYIATIPPDPFGERLYQGQHRDAELEVGMGRSGKYSLSQSWPAFYNTYMFESSGPDKIDDTNSGDNEGLNLLSSQYPWLKLDPSPGTAGKILGLVYDSTNGTKSRGQIFRAGGSAPGDTAAHHAWFEAVTQ